MTTVLLVQLLVSFLVGGSLITLLSLIAEKTNQHIAGIIMMFPTTLVVGFFFLGFTSNAENVSKVIPSTLIPLGIVIFSSVIYIYCSTFYADRVRGKLPQILLSLMTSSIVWFVLVSPFAIYKFSNIAVGVLGFFAIITSSHFILNAKTYESNLARPTYTKMQIVIRAVFTGSAIAIVVLLGKTLNPFWGGIFTMFPAATFATLTILHYYYEPKQLSFFMKNIPLGSVSLFIYAISVMLLFPRMGIWAGTFISYCFALVYSFLLIRYKLGTLKRRNI